ncbi:NAD(P)-binding protein [Alternaria alternata]|uniref:NAD(P)-binding protein n=1 Tax=Alternaria alternata TaxID=5599 RepID=A0A177DAB9_ALTAL|nr:NAD(P)-binding protein [Alternaria alternata]OAG16231.1 NAD(P)-binding protein [Alternaria alternata]RYN57745.1 hypothetical protein AA0118_g7636 [Alternaria tenuissima]RYN78361.1 hypothetical protein AA0120_g11028 [Alternaria tenuissima]
MPSYLVTGASRGIGLAFLDHISSNPDNVVIGLVRNVKDTEAKIASWSRSNVHLVQGDLTNYESLKSAVDATSKITNGSLDYLIASAGLVSGEFDEFSVLGKDPAKMEASLNQLFSVNVVGNIHLFNLFMPLVLKGNVKKVVTISSGMGDTELVRKYNISEDGPYAISKAAVNMAVAKFSAEYAKDGVLFLSISPGVVGTDVYADLSEDDQRKLGIMSQKFMDYSPDFKGAITPEESVKAVLSVVESSSVANGDGGAFLSHLGKGEKWI